MEGAFITSGLRAAVVNVDPSSVNTLTETDQAVTVPGIQVGDILLYVGPLPADDRYYLRRAAVTAADTVTLSWTNETAGTVNPTAVDLTFVWIPLGSAALRGYPMGYQK